MAVDESLTSRVKYLEGEEVKEVLKLVNMSKYLPERTKSLLALPGSSKSDIFWAVYNQIIFIMNPNGNNSALKVSLSEVNPD